MNSFHIVHEHDQEWQSISQLVVEVFGHVSGYRDGACKSPKVGAQSAVAVDGFCHGYLFSPPTK